MPCGCKKGSGVSFRGGGMSIRGGGVRKRKRRRKKRGGALIGADPRTWAPTNSSTNRYAGLGGRSAGFRSASLIGRKRGSGMGFSGSGMVINGAGLRTGRLFLRRGTGRRMI
jgi:hypothetical protein